MYTFIQLTDLHYTDKGEKSFDVDTPHNLQFLIDKISHEQFDELIITGDLAFRMGTDSIYENIKKSLNSIHQPITVISGNHDNPCLLNKYFHTPTESSNKDELYFSRTIENYLTLFLDTSNETLSEGQLNWIDTQLRNNTKNCIVFMHHPPVLCGVKYMDKKYPLQNINELQNIILKYKNTKFHFFCGHYHAIRSYYHKNQNIHVSPSAFYVLNQNADSFDIESYQIGYRKIFISPDSIATTVRLLEAPAN